jgi:hypothetical protein
VYNDRVASRAAQRLAGLVLRNVHPRLAAHAGGPSGSFSGGGFGDDFHAPAVVGVRVDFGAPGFWRLLGLAEAAGGPPLSLEPPPSSDILDFLPFLSRPGSAAACGFECLGPRAALVAPVMLGGGLTGGGGGAFNRCPRGNNSRVLEVAVAAFAPGAGRAALPLQAVDSEADARALMRLAPPVEAWGPVQRVTASPLVTGGHAQGFDLDLEPGGSFPVVMLAAGSLVRGGFGGERRRQGCGTDRGPKRPRQELQPDAPRDATRRAVLLHLAFLFLHCAAAMAVCSFHPSARGDGEQGPLQASGAAAAAAAAEVEPEPEPEWLASAWMLDLAEGRVRVPVPAALGQALLGLLDPESAANAALRAALPHAGDNSCS